jgi:hypothetical protein
MNINPLGHFAQIMKVFLDYFRDTAKSGSEQEKRDRKMVKFFFIIFSWLFAGCMIGVVYSSFDWQKNNKVSSVEVHTDLPTDSIGYRPQKSDSTLQKTDSAFVDSGKEEELRIVESYGELEDTIKHYTDFVANNRLLIPVKLQVKFYYTADSVIIYKNENNTEKLKGTVENLNLIIEQLKSKKKS